MSYIKILITFLLVFSLNSTSKASDEEILEEIQKKPSQVDTIISIEANKSEDEGSIKSKSKKSEKKVYSDFLSLLKKNKTIPESMKIEEFTTRIISISAKNSTRGQFEQLKSIGELPVTSKFEDYENFANDQSAEYFKDRKKMSKINNCSSYFWYGVSWMLHGTYFLSFLSDTTFTVLATFFPDDAKWLAISMLAAKIVTTMSFAGQKIAAAKAKQRKKAYKYYVEPVTIDQKKDDILENV